jgi:hypothetical protein
MLLEWKDIPGYEGFYQISTMGKIRSVERTIREFDSRWGKIRTKRLKSKIITPAVNGTHYSNVMLSKNGRAKSHFVHRLVLEVFVGSCPEGMECCHKDGNMYNNELSNLRWDTRKNNHADNVVNGTRLHGSKNPRAKLTELKVKKILKLWATGDYTQQELADMNEVCQGAISSIVRREKWRHVIVN